MSKTRLRDRADMERCLCDIYSDQHPVKHFYPLLLQHAGEEADSRQIARIITDAVNAYVNRLAQDIRVNAHMVMRFQYGNGLASALVADQEIAREVRILWLASL